jgi:hypothetical protein
VEELLCGLTGSKYYTVVYADDIAIPTNGTFKQTLSEVLQLALGITQQWCSKTHVSINPNKMLIAAFIRKRDILALKEPAVFDKTSQLCTKVK